MKRNVAITVAILAAAAAAACPAWSQDTGAYLGASIGQVEHKEGCEGVSISCDQKDSSWRVFGGYQFNRHLAVELGYADLGESNASGTQLGVNVSATAEVTAWDVSAVGSFPLLDKLFAYGRAGIYLAETEVSATGTLAGFSRSQSESESNTGLVLGLGLKYEFLRNFAVRAEWQRYFEVGGGEVGESDVDVLSLGVLYRF
jgi:OmpA-OmpF porin, OOP family